MQYFTKLFKIVITNEDMRNCLMALAAGYLLGMAVLARIG
jgi:hypothetical protein